MLVTAIKANHNCKPERQNFSVLRSTPLGKHIEPEVAKEAAISLIDCFHRMYVLPHEVSWILLKSSVDVVPWIVWRMVETVKTRSIPMFITSDISTLSIDKYKLLAIIVSWCTYWDNVDFVGGRVGSWQLVWLFRWGQDGGSLLGCWRVLWEYVLFLVLLFWCARGRWVFFLRFPFVLVIWPTCTDLIWFSRVSTLIFCVLVLSSSFYPLQVVLIFTVRPISPAF